MMVAMPTYDRWSNTKKLRTIAKHIEVTVGKKSVDWSDSDFEQEMEGTYVNTSPYREPVYINVHEAQKSASDYRLKTDSDRGLKSSSTSRMSPNRLGPSRPPNPPSSSRPPIPSSSRPPQSSSSTRAVGQPGHGRSHQSPHPSRQGQSPSRHTRL